MHQKRRYFQAEKREIIIDETFLIKSYKILTKDELKKIVNLPYEIYINEYYKNKLKKFYNGYKRSVWFQENYLTKKNIETSTENLQRVKDQLLNNSPENDQMKQVSERNFDNNADPVFQLPASLYLNYPKNNIIVQNIRSTETKESILDFCVKCPGFKDLSIILLFNKQLIQRHVIISLEDSSNVEESIYFLKETISGDYFYSPLIFKNIFCKITILNLQEINTKFVNDLLKKFTKDAVVNNTVIENNLDALDLKENTKDGAAGIPGAAEVPGAAGIPGAAEVPGPADVPDAADVPGAAKSDSHSIDSPVSFDLGVFLLRFVFHYCFYCAKKFDSMIEMINFCGDFHFRCDNEQEKEYLIEAITKYNTSRESNAHNLHFVYDKYSLETNNLTINFEVCKEIAANGNKNSANFGASFGAVFNRKNEIICMNKNFDALKMKPAETEFFMVNHKKSQNGFVCRICEKEFLTEETLKKHLVKKHPAEFEETKNEVEKYNLFFENIDTKLLSNVEGIEDWQIPGFLNTLDQKIEYKNETVYDMGRIFSGDFV